jgi:DNA-binding MarR family transcriptional regulator
MTSTTTLKSAPRKRAKTSVAGKAAATLAYTAGRQDIRISSCPLLAAGEQGMPSHPSLAPMTKKPATADYHFSDQIGHLLRRAYQRHAAIFQQHIPDSQLTAAQFVTLCAIRDLQTCSLSDIVKVTAIDQATIRGIVERLKARDLIELSHDEADRRKVLVSLSKNATALVADTVPFAAQITEATYGNLNPAERVALVFLLRKMIDE